MLNDLSLSEVDVCVIMWNRVLMLNYLSVSEVDVHESSLGIRY